VERIKHISIKVETENGEISFSSPISQGEEKVILTDFGLKKISVIKEIRAATGLPLKESVEITKNLPHTFQAKELKYSSQNFSDYLRSAGAKVEIETSQSIAKVLVLQLIERL